MKMNYKKIIATILAMVSMVGVTTYGLGSVELNNQIEVSADVTTEKAEKLFDLVNKYRVENHLEPFKTCKVMNEMANIRAKEIVGGIYLNRGNNQYYNSIFVEHNISTFTYNQNTYWGGVGYDTPEDALQEIMQSERQKKNILSTQYEYMGVGVYVDGNKTYYYQLFCTSDDLQEDIVTTTPATVVTTVSESIITSPTVTTTDTIKDGLSDDELKQKYNLDVNKNGVINAIDLMILKRYLMGTLKG